MQIERFTGITCSSPPLKIHKPHGTHLQPTVGVSMLSTQARGTIKICVLTPTTIECQSPRPIAASQLDKYLPEYLVTTPYSLQSYILSVS